MFIADLILMLLSVLGLTFIFIHSEIMDMIGLRPFWEKWSFTNKLFKCSMCCPFWLSLYVLAAYAISFWWHFLFVLLTFPFACCAFGYMFERITIMADEIAMEKENIRNKPKKKISRGKLDK